VQLFLNHKVKHTWYFSQSERIANVLLSNNNREESVEARKQNISVRLSAADRKQLKQIANRMQVRESELFRFAIKSLLSKLTPLNDALMKGKDLLPVFLDCYSELTRHLDLDASQLEQIINAGVIDPEQRVDRDDIELLAISGVQETYAYVRLMKLMRKQPEKQELSSALKEYLMTKYVIGQAANGVDTL
jgi:hypothetical protein